jgi:hypothetical protein
LEEKIKNLLRNWQRRNIQALYCTDKEEAAEKIMAIIPHSAGVGFSGSETLEEIRIIKRLEARGNKIANPYKTGISRDESLKLRREGAQADYYLASANAISEKGELVFFSGFGNRIAGVSYAKNTIIVAGINKITPNLEEAIKRAREYATPLNCKRLNWNSACLKDGICRESICLLPEYKRMCCQLLIIEAEVTPERLKVIIVGEKLGF